MPPILIGESVAQLPSLDPTLQQAVVDNEPSGPTETHKQRPQRINKIPSYLSDYVH